MPQQPQDYALVIGIDHYPNYRPLRGPMQDARDFADWLTDQHTGGGLDAAHCKVVLSTEAPIQPVLDHIDTALDEIYHLVKDDGARRIYFYFSGHGHTSVIDDVYLCLAKWSTNRWSRAALSFRECCNFLAQCIGFSEIIALADCCRVRVTGAAGLPPSVSCVKPLAAAGQTRIFQAYATEFLNRAYEAEIAAGENRGNAAPIVQGHFTRALLQALKGAAAGPQGGVKVSKLKEYLEREVPRIAAEHNHKQNVRISHNFDAAQDPILGSALPMVQDNVEIRFNPERRGIIELEGPNLTILKRGDVSTGPWLLTLSRGHYLLHELETGQQKHLRFQPQQEVTRVDF